MTQQDQETGLPGTNTGKDWAWSLLRSYCDRNRQAHARQPGGWGYYVQSLYLSLQQEQTD